ncbi:putative amidohydrolase YtcJ [Clostridium tetanomorphum]|uniref:Uncharacterized protein n=1 Tax=Clostridium tetanomorphum TaxID=1553 RepID=A0A923EEW2_CLOTT|nr:hypothetical protein [Clostridium tetanomorphum]KAJ50796.1 D-hydantoinase [Clostridium tetanomorphum DSM 665]MBC2399935.1 hypothetical protein [Clostridium tetanomorphum]MBP1866447.1 putative amidohydrolase YtcJ [Clostridium tetanomorphum]NRS86666.1 putative amidohydrolase YtcJ [Clostridium tetanomorphum]NRZ95330.1 putative amidohydrolase YtcJ [Clostridium tetanomorphum]
MYDLVIKNGFVVSPSATIKKDIAIEDEKVVTIGIGKEFDEAKRIINAEGKYVLPGVIDAHMHVEAPNKAVPIMRDRVNQYSMLARLASIQPLGSIVLDVEPNKKEIVKLELLQD